MSDLKVPLPWTLHKRRDESQYINCGDPSSGSHAAFDISDWPEIGQLIAAAPDLYYALALVRMSMGWQYLSEESRAVIDAALAKALGA